jgi:ribosome-associated toxin RatA of RatAB toxin-antitoxin module
MAQAENEKIYDIDASKYFNAVRDLEKYPEFVDGMKKVKAETSPSGEVTAHYELSMMGKEMSYDLKVQQNETAGTLSWTLLKSDFFKVNNGAWHIESLGAGKCKVKYSLEVEFSFSVPGFMLKPMIKGTLPTMMDSFYNRAKKI